MFSKKGIKKHKHNLVGSWSWEQKKQFEIPQVFVMAGNRVFRVFSRFDGRVDGTFGRTSNNAVWGSNTSTRSVRSVREDAARSVLEKSSWIGHVEGSRGEVMPKIRFPNVVFLLRLSPWHLGFSPNSNTEMNLLESEITFGGWDWSILQGLRSSLGHDSKLGIWITDLTW